MSHILFLLMGVQYLSHPSGSPMPRMPICNNSFLVSRSMFFCDRYVFNWYLKRLFEPPLNLLQQASSLNCELHLGHDLDTWYAQLKLYWRMVATTIGREDRERERNKLLVIPNSQWIERILRKFVWWNLSRTLMSRRHNYRPRNHTEEWGSPQSERPLF